MNHSCNYFFLIIKPSYKQNRENLWKQWQQLPILHTIEYCSRQKIATYWKSPSLIPTANRDYFVIVRNKGKTWSAHCLRVHLPLRRIFFFYSGHNLTKHRELIFTLGPGPLHFPPSWHITVIYYTNYLLCLMKINIPIRALTSLMTVTWFGSSVMPSVRHHYAINSL